MAFLDLTAELTGILQGLSPQLAATHINRAYRKVLDARNWSFLVAYGAVICPPQVTTGTAAITQYSASVTLDAAASAALLAQALGTTQPGLTNLQIRFAPTTPAAGQIYNILAVDVSNTAALVLTLDRVVLEATDATSGLQVYRCYITPPADDFKSWLSFVDMADAFAWTNENARLSRTSAEFDRKDPQRTSQGLAYFLGSYTTNRVSDAVTGTVVPNPNVDAGTPVYELWPHPTQGQNFYVRYRRYGSLFVQPGDTQPQGLPDDLLVQRALGWQSYAFAQANATQFPQFRGINWMQLIASARTAYQDLLMDAKRNDNEVQLQDVWNRGSGLRGGGSSQYPWPVDANFIQSHLLSI